MPPRPGTVTDKESGMTTPAAAARPRRPCLSRRSLLGAGMAGAALWGAGLRSAGAVGALSQPGAPGSWRTWVLGAGDELRPPPPPAPTADELGELHRLQGERTVEVAQMVETWA